LRASRRKGPEQALLPRLRSQKVLIVLQQPTSRPPSHPTTADMCRKNSFSVEAGSSATPDI
jgi:hypothetical protein